MAGNGVKLEGRKSLVPDSGYIKAFFLYETSVCRNCGRPLHSERSQKLGFGPTCAVDFAARYIKRNPVFLGVRAKKLWTEDQVKGLVAYVREAKGGLR